MQSEPHDPPQDTRDALPETIGAKEDRKLRARGERNRSVWFGMGMFGVVGWTVTVPTVLAIVLGIWIDRRWPSRFSWTLMLLFLGVIVGCYNAWYWITHEGIWRKSHNDRAEHRRD